MTNTQEVHVAFGTPDQQKIEVEKARAEASLAAGRELVVRSVRQSHYIDERGRDVYEMWVTLADAPPPPTAEDLPAVSTASHMSG